MQQFDLENTKRKGNIIFVANIHPFSSILQKRSLHVADEVKYLQVTTIYRIHEVTVSCGYRNDVRCLLYTNSPKEFLASI